MRSRPPFNVSGNVDLGVVCTLDRATEASFYVSRYTYIEAQRVKIIETANEQRTIITNENPEPAKCMEMLAKKDRRIWERRSCDRDFLDVSIGMSYEELCVPIKNYAENRGLMMEDDELEELCNSIAEENRLVDFIPKRLPLRTTPTIGVFGNRDNVVHQVMLKLLPRLRELFLYPDPPWLCQGFK